VICTTENPYSVFVVALANEGGGKLIFGIKETNSLPHIVTLTSAWQDKEGKLAEDIYTNALESIHGAKKGD
jgi:hypothetical protein